MSLQVTTQGCLWEPQIPGSLVCINVLVKKMCCVFPEYCFSEIWRLLRIFALHICIYTIYSDVTADHHSWLKILVRKMLGCVFIFFFHYHRERKNRSQHVIPSRGTWTNFLPFILLYFRSVHLYWVRRTKERRCWRRSDGVWSPEESTKRSRDRDMLEAVNKWSPLSWFLLHSGKQDFLVNNVKYIEEIAEGYIKSRRINLQPVIKLLGVSCHQDANYTSVTPGQVHQEK